MQYKFSATLKQGSIDGTSTTVPVTLDIAFHAGNTYFWFPTAPGLYTLKVIACDSAFNTSFTKSITYTVLSPSLTGLSALTATPASGLTLDTVPITLTAIPQGTGVDVLYKFSATLKHGSAGGTFTTVPVTLDTAFHTGNTFAWSPTDPGAYTITVKAYDSTGNTTFSKTLTVTVISGAVTGISSLTAAPGSGATLDAAPITLTAVPQGTGVDVQYKFSATLKQGSAGGTFTTVPVTLDTVYHTGNTYAWSPTVPGTYTIKVTACDSTFNTTFSKTLTYTVLSPALTGISALLPDPVSGSSLAQVPAAGATLTAIPVGNGIGVQYYFTGTLKRGSASGVFTTVPVTLDTAFHTGNTYTGHPDEPGTYTLTVKACDSTFSTAFSKTISYTLLSASLTGLTGVTATPASNTKTLAQIQATGGIVHFAVNIGGDGAGVQYKYQLTRPGAPAEPISDYTTSHAFDLTPLVRGTYTLKVFAYDATYNTSFTKTVSYVVK